MTMIIIAGWSLIAAGILGTLLVLYKGYRHGINKSRSELKQLEQAGFAATYKSTPRKQSVYSGPMTNQAPKKEVQLSRKARRLLAEVEDDIKADNEAAIRKDNTIDTVLDPLRRERATGDPVIVDTSQRGETSSSSEGTSILRDDEVKEIKASAGTDVLFSASYDESEKTEETNDEGTGVLPQETEPSVKGTDVLMTGNETEPLISVKDRQLMNFKEKEEAIQSKNTKPAGTDILAEGTGLLPVEVDSEGTGILENDGTGILPEESKESGTDILDEGGAPAQGTDILTEDPDDIEEALSHVIKTAQAKCAEEQTLKDKLASLQTKIENSASKGTAVLNEGTGILPDDQTEPASGTDILDESDTPAQGTDILPGGTDILPEGTGMLNEPLTEE